MSLAPARLSARIGGPDCWHCTSVRPTPATIPTDNRPLTPIPAAGNVELYDGSSTQNTCGFTPGHRSNGQPVANRTRSALESLVSPCFRDRCHKNVALCLKMSHFVPNVAPFVPAKTRCGTVVAGISCSISGKCPVLSQKTKNVGPMLCAMPPARPVLPFEPGFGWTYNPI